MDSIAAANSGHLGLPLGCAEMGAILFGTESGLNYNPSDPQWLNRDRFILSAGHGSMFVYSWLHLAGYEISLEEVKNFRQHHSMTPGHPEFPSSLHATPGIESTTGPLGQVTRKIITKSCGMKRAVWSVCCENVWFSDGVLVPCWLCFKNVSIATSLQVLTTELMNIVRGSADMHVWKTENAAALTTGALPYDPKSTSSKFSCDVVCGRNTCRNFLPAVIHCIYVLALCHPMLS